MWRKRDMTTTQIIKEYEYIISTEHHLVKIDDKVFLIDTGSPISFYLAGNIRTIKINENNYDVKENIIKIDGEVLNEFVGVNIDGIIGADILSKTGGVYFDKISKTVKFTSKNDFQHSVRVPLKVLGALGYYYIVLQLNTGGNSISAILDTGAYMSYIDQDIARHGIPNGNAIDFAPMFGGWINTTTVILPVSIGTQTQSISFAVMTKAIKTQVKMFGCKAILGINEISWDKLSIDFESKELMYG
jgi:hypothetical protein